MSTWDGGHLLASFVATVHLLNVVFAFKTKMHNQCFSQKKGNLDRVAISVVSLSLSLFKLGFINGETVSCPTSGDFLVFAKGKWEVEGVLHGCSKRCTSIPVWLSETTSLVRECPYLVTHKTHALRVWHAFPKKFEWTVFTFPKWGPSAIKSCHRKSLWFSLRFNCTRLSRVLFPVVDRTIEQVFLDQFLHTQKLKTVKMSGLRGWVWKNGLQNAKTTFFFFEQSAPFYEFNFEIHLILPGKFNLDCLNN